MGRVYRHILHFVGIALDLIGLSGVVDDLATWENWLGWLHSHTSDWYVYLPLFVVGNLLLALTWSYWIVDSRLARRGGVSGREFPARLDKWDEVQWIAVWHVAWLWNGLEPQSGESSGTPAYATFQRLKEDLNSGQFGQLQKKGGSWAWVRLDRQTLIDYALFRRAKPAFLYKSSRRPKWIQWPSSFFVREIPYIEAKKHPSLSYVAHTLALSDKTSISDVDQIKDQLIKEANNGDIQIIGRVVEDEYKWHYTKISARKLKGAKLLNFEHSVCKRRQYTDLRVIFAINH